jgi:hypothetical protein
LAILRAYLVFSVTVDYFLNIVYLTVALATTLEIFPRDLHLPLSTLAELASGQGGKKLIIKMEKRGSLLRLCLLPWLTPDPHFRSLFDGFD